MPASKDYLYIDCTSNGLGKRPSVPIFNGKKICLQAISQCQQVYSAAALGAVEARFSDNDEVIMAFCYLLREKKIFGFRNMQEKSEKNDTSSLSLNRASTAPSAAAL